jgi:hypothetical protein
MRYAKFIAAIVATILSAIVAALGHGHITPVEWVLIAIAGVNAVSVVLVPNLPGGIAAYSKALVTVLMAVLTALTAMVAAPMTLAEWLQIVVIALGALGVYLVPNTPAAVPAAQTEYSNRG